MSFWKRRKRTAAPSRSTADAGQIQRTSKPIKRSPPVAMEVKLLAIEALGSGLAAEEVRERIGVGPSTVHRWRKDDADEGIEGLCRKASSITIRKQSSVLRDKIVAMRRHHPEHGVRRIRDDLRRHDGLEVSAETVRTALKEGGSGHALPQPRRRPAGVRPGEQVGSAQD
ncbi:MAG: helix-turn-helix domain-containing protein [Acidobacteriota bacterium]|nr:MAG: helix-turn-helix domain-containing protein [Acidobacteriota bacterium]